MVSIVKSTLINVKRSFLISNICYLNSIIKSNKLSHWLFGHTHYDIYNKIDGVEYICNPRGRPDDFNRLEYDLKTLIIH